MWSWTSHPTSQSFYSWNGNKQSCLPHRIITEMRQQVNVHVSALQSSNITQLNRVISLKYCWVILGGVCHWGLLPNKGVYKLWQGPTLHSASQDHSRCLNQWVRFDVTDDLAINLLGQQGKITRQWHSCEPANLLVPSKNSTPEWYHWITGHLEYTKSYCQHSNMHTTLSTYLNKTSKVQA